MAESERIVEASEMWPEIRAAYTVADYSRCETLLAELPETEQTRFWGVRVASRQDQFETVRDRATTYLADYPVNIEIVQLVARAANKLKDVPLAASSWRQLAELAPDPVDALRQAARASAKLGNDSYAIAAAGRLTAIAEQRPDVLPIAAKTLLELDQFDALASLVARVAVVDAAAASALVEAFSTANESRGLAAALAGLQKGAPDAAASIGAKPVDAESLIENLLSAGVRRERDGAHVDALNDFRAVLVLSPADALACHGIERLAGYILGQARALNRIGEFGEAIDSFRTMYRSDPTNPDAMLPYGRALMNAGELELAEDLWRAVIAVDPGLEEARLQLARALERLDRPIEAIAAWNAVTARWPGHEEAGKHRRKLSQTVFKLGRDAVTAEDGVAAATYMMAVPADATERESADHRLERIGRILLKGMRADYKTRDFTKVVAAGSVGRAIAPASVDIHRLLGKAAAKLRQYDLAATVWEHVATLQDNAEAQIEIAKNRTALRDYDAAERAVAAAASFDSSIEGLGDVRKTIAAGRTGETRA